MITQIRKALQNANKKNCDTTSQLKATCCDLHISHDHIHAQLKHHEFKHENELSGILQLDAGDETCRFTSSDSLKLKSRIPRWKARIPSVITNPLTDTKVHETGVMKQRALQSKAATSRKNSDKIKYACEKIDSSQRRKHHEHSKKITTSVDDIVIPWFLPAPTKDELPCSTLGER